MLRHRLAAVCALIALTFTTGPSSNVSAQELGNGTILDLLGQGGGAPSAPVTDLKIDASLHELPDQPDQIELRVKVGLPVGFYIYSMNPSFSGKTRIDVTNTPSIEPVDDGFRPDHEPKRVFDKLLEQNVEKFFKEVTWSKRYRLTDPAQRANVSIRGTISGSYCSTGVNGRCIPIRRKEFQARLEDAGAPAAETAAAPQFVVEKQATRTRRGKESLEPIAFRFELQPSNVSAGNEVTLSITARPETPYHIFATTQDPDGAGLPTEITIEGLGGLEPVDKDWSPDHEPEETMPFDGETLLVHHDSVTWSKRFLAKDDGTAIGVSGSILYQICKDGACRNPNTVAFVLGNADAISAGSNANVAALPAPVAKPVPAPGDSSAQPAPTEPADAAAAAPLGEEGLLSFLIAAMVAGFAALLTPCVFPMVPITVSFFLKQSEKEHSRPVRLAIIYCAGIVGTFTVLGLLMAVFFGASSLNTLANNPILNLGIAAVLIFFGCNLLGMFEIRVPSWLLTWSSSHEGQGGVIGTLFMALTFTLVSFTCTFAFAGLLLAWAAKGQYYWPVLGMLAFSFAFALPFFFLALFPSFLHKLPKSGGWMNTVKVTMGMIECGAALKFLSVADIAANPVPVMFDYSFVMSAWMIFCICTGLYLLGLFRLPHDTPAESISVLRFGWAVVFLTFAMYLGGGLFGSEEPDGAMWGNIVSIAPPRFSETVDDSDLGPYLEHDGLKYALDFGAATDYASSQNQPLFLDFTGVNCANCRKMEKFVMPLPHNRSLLEKFVRVQLYTDNVPGITDATTVERIVETNLDLQENWFGDVSLPSYAIVTPDGRRVLASYKGINSELFNAFLNDGLQQWQQTAGRDQTASLVSKSSSH